MATVGKRLGTAKRKRDKRRRQRGHEFRTAARIVRELPVRPAVPARGRWLPRRG